VIETPLIILINTPRTEATDIEVAIENCEVEDVNKSTPLIQQFESTTVRTLGSETMKTPDLVIFTIYVDLKQVEMPTADSSLEVTDSVDTVTNSNDTFLPVKKLSIVKKLKMKLVNGLRKLGGIKKLFKKKESNGI